jgi:hypothetical protein
MTNWEYLVIGRVGGNWTDDKFDRRNPQEKLTDLGRDGWDLVSVCYDGGGYNYFLKRSVGEKVKTSKKK